MNKDEMEYQKWVYCPVCGNKTRVRLRKDTVLLHFPLFCPKCKKESLIDAEGFTVRLIGCKIVLCLFYLRKDSCIYIAGKF